MGNKSINFSIRIMHRYVGYFVFGLVIIYSLAGITLIFRDTEFMKKEKEVTTINQTIYKEIRTLMDNGCKSYRVKQEYEKK